MSAMFALKGARRAVAFIGVLLGASMLIRFIALSEDDLASRHVFTHHNQLLSTLRAVCDSPACQRYSWELQASLDTSRNPCHGLHDFVCGRWRRDAVAPSARQMAEARVLKQAMLSVLNANSSETVAGAASEKVVALVQSCLHARHDPSELAEFLKARGILPCRKHGPYVLLSTLVDLSVNWDIHVWFHLRIAAPNGAPATLHIRRSRAFDQRVKVLTKTRNNKKYRRNVEAAFRILGLRHQRLAAAVSRASQMDTLIKAVIKASRIAPETGPLVVDIETMAANLTPAASAGTWLGALRAVERASENISQKTSVHIQSTQVLRTFNSLFEFGKRKQEYAMEHIAYQTFLEIGWMVDDHNATGRGYQRHLTPEEVAARCLRQVEKMTGRAWFSLLPLWHDEGRLQRDVLGALQSANASTTNIASPSDAPMSFDVLPPLQASFFADWLAYGEARRDLTHSGLYDILRADGDEHQVWSVERNLTVEPLIFSYPFFHSQLHPVINYAGAGRLLARALLSLHLTNASAETIEEKAVATAFRALHEGRELPGGNTAGFPNNAATDQLFYMASCYAVCDAGSRKMCDGPVMRLWSYRKAFGCSPPLAKISPTPRETFIDFHY
ncbi:hypothetical protein V5799_013252 [Amblyomma americanum]|uniref:Peptidase M13 N-terminal domain-containing protein n=1 Tax=Amblyomma americanum TaxID=6943 RepID=A0AAQ4E6G4_AMBAM